MKKIALFVGILVCAFLVWRFIIHRPLLPELPPPVLSASVAISPSFQSGLPGENLLYIVTLMNTGNVWDTFVLTVSDNSGWGLALSDNLLEVRPGENQQTTLRVTIPENATPSSEDAITVIVLFGDEVIDNANCFARVENKILIHVYVKLDPPPENAINDITYKLREGTPTEVGVYRAYLWQGRWGAWSYERLDTIPLEKVDNLTLYGAKSVSKTNPVLVVDNNLQMYNNALCVGYPGIKYALYWIDGITLIQIDQSEEEATVTVHYWEGSAPIPPGDTSSRAPNWPTIVLILLIVLITVILITVTIVRFVKRARLI